MVSLIAMLTLAELAMGEVDISSEALDADALARLNIDLTTPR